MSEESEEDFPPLTLQEQLDKAHNEGLRWQEEADRLRDVANRVERFTSDLWYNSQLTGKSVSIVRTVRGIVGGVRDILG